MAQLVKRPTSVQVMISWFVSLSPMLGFLLTAQSLELSLGSVSLPFSAPPMFMLCLSIINKKSWGAWVAQLVERPALAQIMISQSVSSSPGLGSVLTA